MAWWMTWVALAAPPDAFLIAEDLRMSGRPEEAVVVAVARLNVAPDDLGAHWASITSRTRGLREGAATGAQYQRWVDEAPDALTPKFGLAVQQLMTYFPEGGAWCQRFEGLIGGDLPPDAEARAWVLRARLYAARACDTDAQLDLEALAEVARRDDLALANLIRERALREGVTAPVADLHDALIERAPELSVQVGSFRHEGFVGDAVGRAAAAQSRAMMRLARDERPWVVAFAAAVLSDGTPDERTVSRDAITHLYRIDPGRSWTVPKASGLARWYARDRPRPDDPSRKLALARQVEAALAVREAPSSAYAATDALQALWRTDPSDREVAFAFARAAGATNRQVLLGIGALDYSLGTLMAWDARGLSEAQSYAAWQDESRAIVGLFLSERGWLRWLEGHESQAISDLSQALLTHPAPLGHMHLRLGLVYLAKGADEAALKQFALGLRDPGPYATEDLVQRCRVQAQKLYTRSAWAHDGLNGWILDADK